MSLRRLTRRTALSLCFGMVLGGAAAGQQLGLPQSAILTINSERLFSDSAFGQRVAREIEEESTALAAENRRIEAELTEEEHALTEKRATMEPQEFRALADAFDAKVAQIRQEQDGKARALTRRGDEARGIFLDSAQAVLSELMLETGAAVILERSSVFLSANATDITSIAIERIDAAIGDGSELPTQD